MHKWTDALFWFKKKKSTKSNGYNVDLDGKRAKYLVGSPLSIMQNKQLDFDLFSSSETGILQLELLRGPYRQGFLH